ncbi:glycosyltransferase [Flavobacterium sp. 120]|uniref:glycosyltransferase n=1 Tax=Flavobacterium sp. 120 TaxID=2135626 RepID=UPI000EB447DF|nr:glycosyltransferase [Flavobacterium sp. 120]RKS13302.1 hypothetical protein C8C87_0512 [Flavobacterium sp. 120]
MKTIFLCGSAEPGKDGVGDYTRRLAGELIRQGHQAQILSLCDKQSTSFVEEIQVVEETPVLVRRIPIMSTYKQRLVWTLGILKEESPDWISLQYVPYSFHSKGLPLWLPRFLKKLEGNHNWHVMFHELWLGIKHNASYKEKVYGFFQKNIIYRLCNTITFKSVHTSTDVYQNNLSKINVDSLLLELFGNIPIVNNYKKIEVKKFIKFIHFGSLHPEANEVVFLNKLSIFFKSKSISFQINFVGNTGSKIENWINTANSLGIITNVLGMKSDVEISKILLESDYGVTTNPIEFITKSGSAASMVEHGLSILSAREDQKPLGIKSDLSYVYYSNETDMGLLIKSKKQKPVSRLSKICQEFLKSLN